MQLNNRLSRKTWLLLLIILCALNIVFITFILWLVFVHPIKITLEMMPFY